MLLNILFDYAELSWGVVNHQSVGSVRYGTDAPICAGFIRSARPPSACPACPAGPACPAVGWTAPRRRCPMTDVPVRDRRVRRTRRNLGEALIALIVERGYDRITVQDILDRADVGRS